VSGEVAGAVKQVGDVAAASVTVLTVTKVLPAVAAFFAIVWYSVALYEKITGRQFSESQLARFLSRK
jgi:hypothetical protein